MLSAVLLRYAITTSNGNGVDSIVLNTAFDSYLLSTCLCNIEEC